MRDPVKPWDAMKRTAPLLALLAGCFFGCGADPTGADAATDAAPSGADAGVDAGPPEVVPDLVCPGDEGCPAGGDGALHAGAAAVSITPPLSDNEPLTVDVDGDGDYDPEDGDTYEDVNGNGAYDAVWLAGFGNGRRATEVLNDAWARALALRNGETTVVFVVLDVVGFFFDDAEPIRAMTADLDVDYVVVSATHSHESRDTIGIWGRTLDETGRSDAYMAFVQERAARAVREAVDALERAHVQYASLRLRDLPGGVLRYVSDTRDPQVIDDEVRVMRFVTPEGATVSTFVNFAAHPEYMGSRNTRFSSDFPHWLREGVEVGVDGPEGARRDGVGGVTVFVNGALGSQIGPGAVRLESWEGEPVERNTEAAARTVGSQLAWHVLGALGPDGGSTTDETAALAFRRHRFRAPIENRRYHIAYLSGLFTRGLYDYDPDRAIRRGNFPYVQTEALVLDVGRAQLITAPGELDPALFVGGYDGAYAPTGVPVVDETAENPPELSRAPEGPYLRDLARPDAEQVWLLGLTGDFLGYFIPEFDYELDPGVPYIAEAPGDHYEETNSIGESGWPIVHRVMRALLRGSP